MTLRARPDLLLRRSGQQREKEPNTGWEKKKPFWTRCCFCCCCCCFCFFFFCCCCYEFYDEDYNCSSSFYGACRARAARMLALSTVTAVRATAAYLQSMPDDVDCRDDC